MVSCCRATPTKIKDITRQLSLLARTCSLQSGESWGTGWGTGVPKLTALEVRKAKPGIYHDGDGLYLCVSPSMSHAWVFRFSWRGSRPEMGLGSFVAKTELANARDARDEARRVLRSGRNPIDVRNQERRLSAKKPTFGEIADNLLAAKTQEWRNAKHQDQWRWSLTTGAARLRPCPVDEIDTEAVLGVLKPLWVEKPETAARLRGRIEAVLNAAKAQGHRQGENPAAWRGHLSHLLPKRGKLSRGHHAAMAYRDLSSFMKNLRADSSVAARALEACILTATRTGELLGARFSEIDLGEGVWTIPAIRTKAGREHRVPLSSPALKIVETLSELRTCDFVFPSPRGKRPLSHVAMAKVLTRLGVAGATVHGFRSAFRDWAGNETNFPREVAEAALAHTVGDKAEQAYRRSDALEKRRNLMAAWAAYCEPSSVDEKVTPLRRKA
jgi:integrase